MINSASQSPEFRPPQAQIAPELSQIDQKVASLEPHIHKSGPIPTDVWKSHVLNRLTIPELFCVARVSKSNLLHVYAKLQVDYPFLLPKNEPNALVAVREAKDLYKELIAASKNALLQAVRKREGFRDFMTLENVLKSDMIGTISRLDIDNKSDKSIFIPAEIGKFTSLERLTASGCSLIGIDPQIGKCQKLIYIDISHNPLFSLPNALQSCQILMSLDISECNFDKVPQCVFELVKLVSLNVASNKGLTQISEDIGKLSELKQIQIEGTQIIGMPHTLSNCKALKQISANDVDKLDPGFIQDFYSILQIHES